MARILAAHAVGGLWAILGRQIAHPSALETPPSDAQLVRQPLN